MAYLSIKELMDELTKEFQSFLVRLRYEPDCINEKVYHYLEHLFHLLNIKDEEAVCHYFGVLGREQQALDDIAKAQGLTPEATMEAIDICLHKLAITPEWQMVKQLIKE